jgi:hypothetical protein
MQPIIHRHDRMSPRSPFAQHKVGHTADSENLASESGEDGSAHAWLRLEKRMGERRHFSQIITVWGMNCVGNSNSLTTEVRDFNLMTFAPPLLAGLVQMFTGPPEFTAAMPLAKDQLLAVMAGTPCLLTSGGPPESSGGALI